MPFRRTGNIYKCFYCYKYFHKAIDLKEHTATHVDANQHTRFVSRCGIRSSTNLDITGLKCKKCNTEFDGIIEILTHLKENHDETCNMDALKHIACYKLSDGDMKCLICDEEFEFFNNLMLHTLRKHKTFRRLTCEICDGTFAGKKALTKHHEERHSNNQKAFQCRHCEKIYSSTIKRRDHERRIHDEKARTCHICGEVLGSTFIKANHMVSVHEYMPTQFKCDGCPKVFRLQHQLVRHTKRVHLKERKKVCQVCGDKFIDNRQLGLHMVRHSDSKPFECDYCNKRFPRKRALEMHVRIHTNDRRCVCKLCKKAFIQTASLKFHMRVHHGIEKEPKD